MYSINTVVASELHRLRPLMEAFAAEVGYPRFSSDSFEGAWTGIFAINIGEIFYIEGENKDIVAALGANFIADPFSGNMCAMENFWFVREDKREIHLGMQLFNHFEQAARARGCKRILMVHLANSKADVLPKFYESRGYRLAEQTFVKDLWD